MDQKIADAVTRYFLLAEDARPAGSPVVFGTFSNRRKAICVKSRLETDRLPGVGGFEL